MQAFNSIVASWDLIWKPLKWPLKSVGREVLCSFPLWGAREQSSGSARTFPPYKQLLTSFQARPSVRKVCGKDKMSTPWRASLSWKGSGVSSCWGGEVTPAHSTVTHSATFTWTDALKFKWYSDCGSSRASTGKIHRADNKNYILFRGWGGLWSDLAPTRDRKGLLSLSFALVVLTPLSRIIPAWMKQNKPHVKPQTHH